jgi:hypothetical protein
MKEIDFEKIVFKILKEIAFKRKDIVLLSNKKFSDITICKNGKKPELYFIEVKFYKAASGRIHIGGRGGSGIQPEIIEKQPDYFMKQMRWVIGDENYRKDGVVFCDTKTIINYVSGGIIDKKHNNIKLDILKKESKYFLYELKDILETWIK